MDEPALALDPISRLRIEELIQELKQNYIFIIVTYNMQQAARASDFTAFCNMKERDNIPRRRQPRGCRDGPGYTVRR